MGKSGWTSLLAAIAASVATAVTPQLQSVLSHHPTATVIIGSILGIVAHWLPSPADPKV